MLNSVLMTLSVGLVTIFFGFILFAIATVLTEICRAIVDQLPLNTLSRRTKTAHPVNLPVEGHPAE